jgi:hypothetical protein
MSSQIVDFGTLSSDGVFPISFFDDFS